MNHRKEQRKSNTRERYSFPFYLIKDWWVNINTAQLLQIILHTVYTQTGERNLKETRSRQ